jgi:hypothetical protein
MGGVCRKKMLCEHAGERSATDDYDVERTGVWPDRIVSALKSFIEAVTGISA